MRQKVSSSPKVWRDSRHLMEVDGQTVSSEFNSGWLVTRYKQCVSNFSPEQRDREVFATACLMSNREQLH
jgi:hypothetical protein